MPGRVANESLKTLIASCIKSKRQCLPKCGQRREQKSPIQCLFLLDSLHLNVLFAFFLCVLCLLGTNKPARVTICPILRVCACVCVSIMPDTINHIIVLQPKWHCQRCKRKRFKTLKRMSLQRSFVDLSFPFLWHSIYFGQVRSLVN